MQTVIFFPLPHVFTCCNCATKMGICLEKILFDPIRSKDRKELAIVAIIERWHRNPIRINTCVILQRQTLILLTELVLNLNGNI
jgi:hypothetical protein